MEPPDWWPPVRHTLGAVLLDAGRPEEAEAVYREDLERNRENGWALMGLAQALRAQGRDAEAEPIEQRAREAFQRANEVPSSSRW